MLSRREQIGFTAVQAFMKQMLCLAAAGLLAMSSVEARVKMVALPERARVVVSLTNPDATLVEEERLIATAAVTPVRGARPGALERGRVISPLAVDAPRIAADERGTVSFASSEAFAPFGAVQTADPDDGEPVAAWCRASTGAVFVAVSTPPRRTLIDSQSLPTAVAFSKKYRSWVK